MRIFFFQAFFSFWRRGFPWFLTTRSQFPPCRKVGGQSTTLVLKFNQKWTFLILKYVKQIENDFSLKFIASKCVSFLTKKRTWRFLHFELKLRNNSRELWDKDELNAKRFFVKNFFENNFSWQYQIASKKSWEWFDWNFFLKDCLFYDHFMVVVLFCLFLFHTRKISNK